MDNLRCRRIKRNGVSNDTIVWFGSVGKDPQGKAIFYADDKGSFGSGNEAVADSLQQRLSVIEGELWYDIQTGLPLCDRIVSRAEMDLAVLDIVLGHPDVEDVIEIVSTIMGHQYSARITVQTVFGEVTIAV